MGCASSSPLAQGGIVSEAADSVADKVRQTVTGMADAVPVQEMIDGATHVKDEALHKLHDFGETMKDKVESVVEDVEETIGSALGAAKEKANEEMEDAKDALAKLEQSVEETTENAVEGAEKKMDTMVEDLEESLPQPPRSESQAKDFQMDTLDVRPQSQASTARLSRKSGEEEEIKRNSPLTGGEITNGDSVVERDSLNSPKDPSVNSLKIESGNNDLDTQNENKESVPQDVDSESRASKKLSSPSGLVSLSRQESKISNQGNELIIEPESEIPVSAIPVEREDSPGQESDKKSLEEDKEKEEQKSPLTVELLPEEKDEKSNSPTEEPAGSRPNSEIHHTPTPIPPPSSPPRLESSQSGAESEADVSPQDNPQELVVDNEESLNENFMSSVENKSPTPNGKNDSAISSSSSVRSEPQREDQPI